MADSFVARSLEQVWGQVVVSPCPAITQYGVGKRHEIALRYHTAHDETTGAVFPGTRRSEAGLESSELDVKFAHTLRWEVDAGESITAQFFQAPRVVENRTWVLSKTATRRWRLVGS
jgi:hypothetical protein